MSRRIWFILFSIFFVLRIALFNVNVAEFGDSYSYFRIAEAITRGQYPLDAKRLPVFPALIAIGLPIFGAVFWAKVVILLASLGNLVLVLKLANKLFPKNFTDQDYLFLGLVFMSCPIILYWWLRIIAAPVFAFWVLLAFNIFYDAPRTLSERVAVLSSSQSAGGLNRVLIWVYTVSAAARRSTLRYLLLGVTSGLAAMTRYEGFLLFGALGAGILVQLITEAERPLRFFAVIKQIIFPLLVYSFFFLLVVSPWFIRNYINFGQLFYSLYMDDPAGFIIDFYRRVKWIYYALFMFGVPFGFWVLLRGLWETKRNSLAYLPLYVFVFLSLVLFFFWSPIARFYSYLAPLLFPFFVLGIRSVGRSEKVLDSFVFLLLLVVYFVGIWQFGFYFLGAGKWFKLVTVLLGAAAVGEEILKIFVSSIKPYSYRLLVIIVLLIQITAAAGIIKNNRLVYSTVYKALHDPVLEQARTVVYWDETGLSHWYLRDNGLYYDLELPVEEQFEWLKLNNADYVFWTNEHNEGSEIELISDKVYRDSFEPVTGYSCNIGGLTRTSIIYRFSP